MLPARSCRVISTTERQDLRLVRRGWEDDAIGLFTLLDNRIWEITTVIWNFGYGGRDRVPHRTLPHTIRLQDRHPEVEMVGDRPSRGRVTLNERRYIINGHQAVMDDRTLRRRRPRRPRPQIPRRDTMTTPPHLRLGERTHRAVTIEPRAHTITEDEVIRL